jgi:predicted DNA-binding antitoxin AbrB/MazE fold protein
MATTVKVIYEDGVFKPQEPVSLPEHAEAYVLLPSPVTYDKGDDPTGRKALDELIGIVKDAPADMAEHHDKYLYGFRK